MFWVAIGIITLGSMAIGVLVTNVLWVTRFGPDKLGAAYLAGFEQGTKHAQALAAEALMKPATKSDPLITLSKPRIPQNPYRFHKVT